MTPWKFITRPDPKPWPAIIDAPAGQGEPYVYRVPFPPQAGRRVRDVNGHVWLIDPTGDVARTDDPSIILTWGQLIATGPLALLELTDQEKASEDLYGPVGARWGIPGTPCAFGGCALDTGHAGVHQDQHGQALGVTAEATELYVQPPAGAMLSRICTCGVIRHTALQHEPGCARYVTPNDGGLVPTGWDPERTSAIDIIAPPADEPAPGMSSLPVENMEPAIAKPRATKRTRSAGTSSTPATGRRRAPRKAQP